MPVEQLYESSLRAHVSFPASDGDAVAPIKAMSTGSNNGYGKPMEFYNQDVAPRAILSANDKLRAYVERDKLRLLNSYATCLINAVNCMKTSQCVVHPESHKGEI